MNSDFFSICFPLFLISSGARWRVLMAKALHLVWTDVERRGGTLSLEKLRAEEKQGEAKCIKCKHMQKLSKGSEIAEEDCFQASRLNCKAITTWISHFEQWGSFSSACLLCPSASFREFAMWPCSGCRGCTRSGRLRSNSCGALRCSEMQWDAVRIWTESMSDSSLAKAKSTMSSRFELLHPLISSHFFSSKYSKITWRIWGFRDCRAKGGLLDRDEVLSAASALAAVPFSSRQVLLDDVGVNHRMS